MESQFDESGSQIVESNAFERENSQLYINKAVYDVNWYDPPNPIQWLANAFASITIIVQDYCVDGIDIDIERFPNGACILVSHRATDYHSEQQ